ncbi:histidine kinase N-terminal 7TM domain-containing protein [Chloroflexota bacterium]
MIYPLYLSSLVISTILLFVLSFIFWRRRLMRGAVYAAWFMISAAIYAFGTVLQLINTAMPSQIIAEDIQYIGIVFIPVAWFIFAIRYTGRDYWFTKKVLLLLLIIPVATILLAWTNSFHELIWYNRHIENSGPFIILHKGYGLWFWIFSAYSYILILLGTLTLIRRLFRSPRLYRQQSIALVIAVLVPAIWNVFYIFNLVPIYRIDLTPSAFTISGLAIMWGLFRSRLFDIVPIAYGNIMEASNHNIIMLDRQNRIIDMNKTAENTINCPISKAIGHQAEDILSNYPELVETLHGKSGKPPEIVMQTGETSHYYILHISSLKDTKGNFMGRMINLIDNTEYRQMEIQRKELENQTQLMSRLSTVGEMAAGIAHEVSNPLGTVLGYAELLLKRDIPDDIRDDLEIIDKGAKRAASILERLLSFAGQQNGEHELLNINSIIESTIEFRKHSLTSNNITVTKQFDNRLPQTTASSIQLQEVFLNLLMNAESSIMEARNKGGITIISETKGAKIHVSFIDDGTGISQENKEKIFNPFFTTKKVGEGTGLGLSICHGIISSHGGEISVESEPGNGSTFTISLPIIKSRRNLV